MTTTLNFFLSPGRSGTQWIGDRLARHYSDLAMVEHEPIHADYLPRRALRAPDLEELAHQMPAIKAKLNHIDASIASGKHYIEAGWCVFPWIPWFIARYPGRVRLVHFTRHPVHFAYSTESHAFYQPELRDDGYTRNAQLQPSDPGVLYGDYAARWPAMCPFEKCLYQWLEVNAYILELSRDHPRVPYLHMRMEELTSDNPLAWQRLLDFLNLPKDRLPADPERTARVDQFRFQIDRVADPSLVTRHPRVLEMAAALGYDALAVDRQAAARRYERSPVRRVARNIVRGLLGRYYNPIRRRMVERRQARNSPGSAR
jgi:hypothetical protein